MSEKQALVPRLRFPEFRDAGEWEFKKLGDKDISSFVKKRVSVSDLDLDSYVSTENILPDFGGIKGASKLPPSGSFTSYKPEDILIANIRPYLKKVWVADRNGAASNDVVVVRPMKGIRGSFLSSLLRSESFIDYVMKGAKGVKMPRGDVSLMKEYSFAVPCPKEQQKIADCLTSLDTLISAQAEKIDALKTHKKGLMQKLFPRECETFPRLRFPEFRDAGEWEKKPLTKVFSIFQGYAFSSKDSVKKGVRWLKIADVGIQEMDLNTPSYLPVHFNIKFDRFLTKTNDYVVALTRPILNKKLKIAKVEAAYDGALLNQRVGKLVSDENLDFIYCLLQTERLIGEIEKNIAGNDPPNLSSQQIGDISVHIPMGNEQQKIADCLSSLDALITAQGEKTKILKAHKKALMRQLFPSVEVDNS